MSTTYDALLQTEAYKKAKQDFVAALRTGLSSMQSIKAPNPLLKSDYERLLKEIERTRGRELFFKYSPSGAGSGPFIELSDGSVKYDLITGIGVNFWGFGNLELLEAELDGIWLQVHHGNLGPGRDHLVLSKALLEAAPKTKLKHVWLTTCGATANEIALKIIRQKKAPATKVFAFKHCFAGRTTALQEITDNPAYRQGQPLYDEVHHLDFFDANSAKSAADQGAAVAAKMAEVAAKEPGKFAALEFEIVQGEGGFNFGSREFFLPILKKARELGLGIWVDEVQTFGRTGEIFAFQRIGIDEYVDVVTVAKLLQAGAVMYTEEMNPKAGLISGTFSSSASGIRAGIKVMEILKERMTGPNGHIAKMERLANDELDRLKKGTCSAHIKDYTVIGGMIAFTIFDATMDSMKKFLFNLFDLGAIAFYCGHGPYRARMLPPLGAMDDAQLRDVFALIEKAILKTAEEIKT